MSYYEQFICDKIYQRYKDQATVRYLELSLEPPQLTWTGVLHLSNRYLKGIVNG